MAEVVFDRVTKEFADGTVAVRSLELTIGDGELVVLVGPSGCGKTTALRMLAGLETITGGEIRVGGRVVNDVDPSDRDTAMVFQNYALYPHMTARANMAFPLRMLGMRREEREAQVRRVARILAIERYLHRRPSQLSGGQRQRVAMGRALVREPQVFLMDEPLSNLDAKLRLQMRAELAEIQRQLGVTTVYVTHDQVEAMTLGTRVAVLRQGVLQQEASPDRLYREPANMFVAGFIGSPPMNLFEATIDGGQGGPILRIGGQTIVLDAEERLAAGSLDRWRTRRVVAGIRPERLAAAGSDAPPDRILRGVARLREGLGSDALVHFAAPGAGPLSPELAALAHDVEDPEETETATRRSAEGAVLVGRYEPETTARTGESFATSIAPGSLVFFDPDNGRRIGTASSNG